MKLSKQKLKRIIKEEISRALKEQGKFFGQELPDFSAFTAKSDVDDAPDDEAMMRQMTRRALSDNCKESCLVQAAGTTGTAGVKKCYQDCMKQGARSLKEQEVAGIQQKDTRMEGNIIVVTVEKDGKEAEGRHEVRSARRMNLARTAAYEKAVQNWVRKYGKKQP